MEVQSVVTRIVAITVGVLLIGSLLVPQAQGVIDAMNEAGQSNWASLLGVVVIVSIVSLVVVALSAFRG